MYQALCLIYLYLSNISICLSSYQQSIDQPAFLLLQFFSLDRIPFSAFVRSLAVVLLGLMLFRFGLCALYYIVQNRLLFINFFCFVLFCFCFFFAEPQDGTCWFRGNHNPYRMLFFLPLSIYVLTALSLVPVLVYKRAIFFTLKSSHIFFRMLLFVFVFVLVWIWPFALRLHQYALEGNNDMSPAPLVLMHDLAVASQGFFNFCVWLMSPSLQNYLFSYFCFVPRVAVRHHPLDACARDSDDPSRVHVTVVEDSSSSSSTPRDDPDDEILPPVRGRWRLCAASDADHDGNDTCEDTTTQEDLRQPLTRSAH